MILYGTSCTRCERGDLPRAEVMGFDMGSGDETVFARVGMKNGRFTVEDILAADDPDVRAYVNGNKDRMRAKAKDFDDILREAARGRDYYTVPPFVWPHSKGDPRPRPGHYNCRSRVQPTWGDGTPMTDDEADLMNGRYRGAEVITDASDTRGVNARRVGPGL